MVEKKAGLACAIALAAIACQSASAPTVTMVPKDDAAPPASASGPAASSSAPPAVEPRFPNRAALQAAADRAGPGGVVALYLRLDPKTAPPTADERRAALAAAGLGPQTVAGDIATVHMPSDRLEILLAIPWVTSIELPSVKYPR